MSTGEKTQAEHRGLTLPMRWTLVITLAVLIVGLAVSLPILVGGQAPDGDAATDASTATSAPPAIGPEPGATPATGSEVQTPAPRQTHADRLPPLPDVEPRVTTPLPESAESQGALVDGFPTTEMTPPEGSEIISSSIATEGERMQVSLMARSDADRNAILQHYRQTWSAEGLTDAAQSDGSADLVFADAFTNLSLVFSSTSGTGTVFTLYGVYRAS